MTPRDLQSRASMQRGYEMVVVGKKKEIPDDKVQHMKGDADVIRKWVREFDLIIKGNEDLDRVVFKAGLLVQWIRCVVAVDKVPGMYVPSYLISGRGIGGVLRSEPDRCGVVIHYPNRTQEEMKRGNYHNRYEYVGKREWVR